MNQSNDSCDFPPIPHKKITVKDLAKICGVSIGTVDRAINNRGRISHKTKALVMEAVEKYGFVRDQTARTLSSGKSHLIGIVIFTLANEYFSTLLTAIEKEARLRGYATMIMISSYDADTEKACVHQLLSMNVSAILVTSVLQSAEFYQEIQDKGTPVVALTNRFPERQNIPFIGIDDELAMQEGTKAVLSQDYQHILYVAPILQMQGKENISAQEMRLSGFLNAMKNSGVSYTLIDSYERYNALQKFSSSLKTAVICASDHYTVQCIHLWGIQKYGIMGFDHTKTLDTLFPSLTTIFCSAEEIGKTAVSYVIEQKKELSVILPFSFIQGSSI